jgi:hypothetical protein
MKNSGWTGGVESSAIEAGAGLGAKEHESGEKNGYTGTPHFIVDGRVLMGIPVRRSAYCCNRAPDTMRRGLHNVLKQGTVRLGKRINRRIILQYFNILHVDCPFMAAHALQIVALL